MIRHYGFYRKRMICHYVIHPTNCEVRVTCGLVKSDAYTAFDFTHKMVAVGKRLTASINGRYPWIDAVSHEDICCK